MVAGWVPGACNVRPRWASGEPLFAARHVGTAERRARASHAAASIPIVSLHGAATCCTVRPAHRPSLTPRRMTATLPLSDAPAARTADAPLIALRAVTKEYPTPAGAFTALDDVTVEVARGELVAVVGQSGSGKSTLLGLVSGIDRPTRGTVTVGDTAVHALPERAMAAWRGRHVGIVFQFFQLLPTRGWWPGSRRASRAAAAPTCPAPRPRPPAPRRSRARPAGCARGAPRGRAAPSASAA